ncbi:MAG: alpha-glucosidase [Bacteroidetes bacterium]|nr:alpha-glucosidase [Bacteroidota bacterium]
MIQSNNHTVWWKHGVFYHIYPRSFYDSNNDGIGDIRGIIRKLEYLSELGISAIWISPLYQSPMHDFGYDISDYRTIDPVFGDLEDFRSLLREAHERGIRIIMDLVMNHTSVEHPWFIESCSSRDNPKRDWYIWRDGLFRGKPNNWRSAFGSSAWEYDKPTGQYYLHSFLKEMPDLNWRNKELRNTYFKEVRFWLDLGVDGFRLDVINMIVKDKKFRNNPLFFGIPWIQKHVYTRNRPKSIRITHLLRKLLDEYVDRMCVGEIYSLPPGDPARSAGYLGSGDDAINLAFDFSLMFQPWNARKVCACLTTWYDHIPVNGWACNVLSNHDLFRSNSRFGKKKNFYEKSKLLAVLLLTVKGTPFIYYGEEIGMTNGRLTKKQIVDPLGKKFWPLFKGRDRARTPMQWTPGKNAGFSEASPWLPVNPEFPELNVETESSDPASLLNLYRQLIRLRNETETLQSGDWVPLIKGGNGILAFLRILGDDSVLVLLNFRNKISKIFLPIPSNGNVLVSTHRVEGSNFKSLEDRLFPYEAIAVRLNDTRPESHKPFS